MSYRNSLRSFSFQSSQSGMGARLWWGLHIFHPCVVSQVRLRGTKHTLCQNQSASQHDVTRHSQPFDSPVGQRLPLSHSPFGGFHSHASSQHESDRSWNHCPFLHLLLLFWLHFLFPPSQPKPVIRIVQSRTERPTFAAIAVGDFLWRETNFEELVLGPSSRTDEVF